MESFWTLPLHIILKGSSTPVMHQISNAPKIICIDFDETVIIYP